MWPNVSGSVLNSITTLFRVFQVVLRGGGMGNFVAGGGFIGSGNLRRSALDHLNLF